MRKAYQLLVVGTGKVTPSDFKKFFTANGRLIELSRIEQGLFNGATEMPFEYFASVFTKQGKTTVVVEPKRYEEANIERGICKTRMLEAMQRPKV